MSLDLAFGWRTATLFCATLVIVPIAVALACTFENRAANRIMAALLLVLAGVITPWLIGFAGFYDRWPWLTFLPVAQPLFIPPLLLAYVALTTGGTIGSRRLLFAPGLIFTLFESAAFLLPFEQKEALANLTARPAGVLESLLVTVLFLLVLVRGRALVVDYRRRLAEQRSDGVRFALAWLVHLITAMALLWIVWASYALADAIAPVSYTGYMPLYLAIAATSVWLAIEAWRHAHLPWPVMAPIDTSDDLVAKASRDWAADGQRWIEVLAHAQAFRDPSLTLRSAARIVGTNEAYLSRALNEGLGLSFSALIQRLRSEAVADAIERGANADLLTLAHDAGFASKASFNRAFAARFGVAPSVYRRRLNFLKMSSHPAQ